MPNRWLDCFSIELQALIEEPLLDSGHKILELLDVGHLVAFADQVDVTCTPEPGIAANDDFPGTCPETKLHHGDWADRVCVEEEDDDGSLLQRGKFPYNLLLESRIFS